MYLSILFKAYKKKIKKINSDYTLLCTNTSTDVHIKEYTDFKREHSLHPSKWTAPPPTPHELNKVQLQEESLNRWWLVPKLKCLFAGSTIRSI